MKNQAEMTMTKGKSDYSYTVTLDGVVVGKRKSKNPSYTCAAVVIWNRAKAVEAYKINHAKQVAEATSKNGMMSNYLFSSNPKGILEIIAKFRSQYTEARIAKELKEREDFLAKFPTFQSYADNSLEAGIAQLMKHDEIELRIHSYSSRLELLSKAVSRDMASSSCQFVFATLKA